jgi:hypothetical protein
MPSSILNTTKKALGLGEGYDPFDVELIMHINSVLSDLNQLGIGPVEGFAITDETQTWEDFCGNDKRYSACQSYMYVRMKLLWDVSSMSGPVIAAMEKQKQEMEWRINIHREGIVHPLPPEDPDMDDDITILDGGTV